VDALFDKVRYVGEPVAAVAAIDEETADRIVVQTGGNPFYVTEVVQAGLGGSTRPPGSPGRCCAATSRSGIGPVSTLGVAARPDTPTWITPSTTVMVGQPQRPTPGRCAGTITGSSTRVGGDCASLSPGILSGTGD